MRSLGTLIFVVVAAAVAPFAGDAGGAPATRQDARAAAALVDSAAAYVMRYQQELTAVVADENYTQRVVAQTPRDGLRPMEATLTSEIFFMFTEGHDWMAIRDVRSMNGAALENRPDLRQALQLLPAPDVAGRFKSYNSRFNVGRVVRNFNEPTLSLLPLDDRHRARFAFERGRVRQSPDGASVTLKFKERRGPTLIRNLRGEDAFATGEITIEPGTGRVTDAILAVRIGSVRVTLSTKYGFDERLGIMVPLRFGEHYADGVAPRPDVNGGLRRPGAPDLVQRYEEIRCEALYSGFRRFEVRTRIR